MTAASSALEVRGVSKSFGGTAALRNVDLSVAPGESRALVGRNGAGKSTLISILTGMQSADTGSLSIFGEDVGQGGDRDVIGCVYQHSTLAPELTAAENIFVGRYPRRGPMIDWSAIRERGRKALEVWGLARIADRSVADLQPLEQKIVEIARALARGPRILLLDEPTAGLDEGGSQALFERINALRSGGVSILYVSHHLQELFAVCDSVTVLRDGQIVSTGQIADLTLQDIVDAMVGEAKTAEEIVKEKRHVVKSEIAVRLTDVTVGETAQQVSLDVHAGESYGITGLDGSGHIEIARAIAGDLTHSAGQISVGDRALEGGGVGAAIDRGVGFVPEDRRAAGYIPDMSVEENSTLTILRQLRNKVGVVNRKERRDIYTTLAKTWAIKASGPTQAISELSGGNQQKVVLARALASKPKLLVLINPTAGIDVSAKGSIYSTLADLQRNGTTLFICSTDEQDLEICDRVGVMFKGALNTELPAGWTERELVAATQGGDITNTDRQHESDPTTRIEGVTP